MVLVELHNAWYRSRATVYDYFPHLETEEARERQRRSARKKADLEAHYRWALGHDPATRALRQQLEDRKRGRPPGPDGRRDNGEPGA